MKNINRIKNNELRIKKKSLFFNLYLSMNLSRIFLISLISIVTILAVVQITASNFLATDGIDLASIKNQIAALKKENLILKQQIYTLSSLTEVASKAAILGFVPENNIVFLNKPQSLAINQ